MSRKTVCVDLDGTLLNYDGWKGFDKFGDPIPGAVEFTQELMKFADVVIFTCRCAESPLAMERKRQVAEVLDRHGFAYSDIYIDRGKPVASAYIDDRSVVCDPLSWVGPESSYRAALMSAKALCGVIGVEDVPS